MNRRRAASPIARPKASSPEPDASLATKSELRRPHSPQSTMADPAQELSDLLRQDRRYKIEAYAFVFDALGYAHKVLGMGAVRSSEEGEKEGGEEGSAGERHLTGQQLCEAIRQYALEQYGYMAKCVLNSWGVYKT